MQIDFPAAGSVEQCLSDLVATHHAYLRRQVGEIERVVRDIIAFGDGAHPVAVDMQQLIGGLRTCVESQLSMEEEILFPMLVRLQEQTVISKCRNGIIRSRVMQSERDLARIRGVVLRLRDLAEEFISPHGPCEACHELLDLIRALLADLREHTRKESQVVFPWAIEREKALSPE